MCSLGWLNCEENGSVDHSMVRPHRGWTHHTCQSYILEVALPGKYVINQMPVVGAGMHPTGFILVGLLEDGVGHHHVVFYTEIKQH